MGDIETVMERVRRAVREIFKSRCIVDIALIASCSQCAYHVERGKTQGDPYGHHRCSRGYSAEMLVNGTRHMPTCVSERRNEMQCGEDAVFFSLSDRPTD